MASENFDGIGEIIRDLLVQNVFFLLVFLWFSVAHSESLSGLKQPVAGFEPVVPGQLFKFPADHMAHPEFRTEWWYITANLEDETGSKWGIQWTLFRQSTDSQPGFKGWQNGQIWMAHAALSTPEGHFYDERFARGGIKQAGVEHQIGRWQAWHDDWIWQSFSEQMLPASLNFKLKGFEVELDLEVTGPLVLQGQSGFSLKSDQGQASYYYSQPFISITGRVKNEVSLVSLKGRGWLDREWSSQALADSQQGWDWFSLHLNDGQKLMVYRLRDSLGNNRSGSWISEDGLKQHLSSVDINLEITRWGDVKTGIDKKTNLPLDWLIELPAMGKTFEVSPVYDQQWMGSSVPYWEGMVNVIDSDGNQAGVGYMELTGYDSN
jgi:predicted secreted hydrolase